MLALAIEKTANVPIVRFAADGLIALQMRLSSCVHSLAHLLFPCHAIRNLVNTGVSGRRRSSDMVSSE
jgi:hypothetical protein